MGDKISDSRHRQHRERRSAQEQVIPLPATVKISCAAQNDAAGQAGLLDEIPARLKTSHSKSCPEQKIEKNTFSPQGRLIETESRRHGQEKPPERKLSRAEKNGKAHTNAAVKDLVDPKFFILHAPPPISGNPRREYSGRTSLPSYRKRPATGSSLPLMPFSGRHPGALRPDFL